MIAEEHQLVLLHRFQEPITVVLLITEGDTVSDEARGQKLLLIEGKRDARV